MTAKSELNSLVEKMNANPEHIMSEKDRVYQINLEESGPLQIIMKGGHVEVVDGS